MSKQSITTHNDELNTKTRRLQPITNNNNTHDMIQNNCRNRTPVDSFVQLNLKPAIDITVEDYKKTIVPTSITKNSSTNNRPSVPQSIDTNESNLQSITQSNIIKKKSKTSMTNKSHDEITSNYSSNNTEYDKQHSRSSSSSSITTATTTTTTTTNLLSISSNSFEHSKLIPNNDFDSHGSSIATKSSSDNSGSARTGSGSDSDDEHHHHHHQSEKNIFLSVTKPSLSSKTKLINNNDDDTPTMVLNKTSDYRTSQYDRISPLPKQDSYELVQFNANDEHPLLASQVPRFKLPATDDPNNSNNDNFCNTIQRSQQNNLLSSSHQNRNLERHEQYNSNHSNSSRKPSNRSIKKRKQLQQQEIIRTELIPGHRGDRDVDELVMFIDGKASIQQQQNSIPLRPTDTNKFKSLPDINSNNSTSRRKSRKPIKISQELINNNENKTLKIDDDDLQSIDFIDDDEEIPITTNTHSINNTSNEQNISLPNDDESHLNIIDIDSTNDSNTTNGEISLPEWLEPIDNTALSNDNIDQYSLTSIILNNETISEPFVTVKHRRRLTKERRQDNNNLVSSSRSSTNDKRRFQSTSSSSSSTTQNGIGRSTTRNSLSNIKPFVSTTTKEENTNITSPTLIPSQPPQPPPEPSPPPPSISNNLTEQSSSSSSTTTLPKRQSKPPPVVFLNKSNDIELNDVSFGFDVENPILDKPLTPTPPSSSSSSIPNEKENEIDINNLTSTQQSNDLLTNSKPSSSSFRRSYQHQRNNRGPLFYSGTDIRPNHHHRNYSSQSSYIDPLLLLQYNQQQRYAANYSQQLAYMNLLRAPYYPSQSQYVLIPTTYTTTNDTEQDEKILDNGNNQTSEQIQEPLLVYTAIPTQTTPIYYQSNKKSYNDIEQLQQTSIPNIYPSNYIYPTQIQHMMPPHTAYFQPISSPSLLIDTKSQQENTDDDDIDDEHENGEVEEDNINNNYDKSTRLFHQTRQQSSSHIMSNALQLVYSQEKRNVQTDRFNLDQLTAYLAMKWTDTIDHYEQGDDEILLVDER